MAKAIAESNSLTALEANARALRAEMGLWLRVWLENPGVFGVWENLRTRTHLNFPDTHEAGGAS